jgi:hypothetical protein
VSEVRRISRIQPGTPLQLEHDIGRVTNPQSLATYARDTQKQERLNLGAQSPLADTLTSGWPYIRESSIEYFRIVMELTGYYVNAEPRIRLVECPPPPEGGMSETGKGADAGPEGVQSSLQLHGLIRFLSPSLILGVQTRPSKSGADGPACSG